jgi:hypothetical protein
MRKNKLSDLLTYLTLWGQPVVLWPGFDVAGRSYDSIVCGRF